MVRGRAGGVEAPEARVGGGGHEVDFVGPALEDDLTPAVDEARVGPAGIELGDVELELHARELEQMEQKERHVGVSEHAVVGDRTGSTDPRVELAEIDRAVSPVDQKVDVEVTAIALLQELVAEQLGIAARLSPLHLAEGFGEHLVAAPAAAVRRELGM